MHYFNRKGQPIELDEWTRLFEDQDYKVVAQHWVRGWMVSTVWLGLDHSLAGGGAPVIFETMVFPPGDEAAGASVWSGDYTERYATEDAAHAGHDRALTWVRNKLGDDAVGDIMSAAQFGDDWTAPDDASEL